MLLFQTGIRKWYLASRLTAIPMTLSDLQGNLIYLLQAFSKGIFLTDV